MLPGRWSQARRDAAPPAAIDPVELMPSALEAPRWDFDPLGRIRLESRFPAEVRRRLQRMGHAPVRGGPWDGAGFVQVIARLPDGVSLGATDPRGEGAVLGL
jgi:gamma-glutamyltranspeptidase